MSIRIGLGLTTFPFSGASAFWRFVERCEASELDSLWQSDRLVSSQPHLETMSVMAALAGATDRLKFGMNVAVVTLRDPLVLAKECATIDVLSGGRLLIQIQSFAHTPQASNGGLAIRLRPQVVFVKRGRDADSMSIPSPDASFPVTVESTNWAL